MKVVTSTLIPCSPEFYEYFTQKYFAVKINKMKPGYVQHSTNEINARTWGIA